MLSSTLVIHNNDESINDKGAECQPELGVTAARKLAAAQKRASRKAARRSRMFSESTINEVSSWRDNFNN